MNKKTGALEKFGTITAITFSIFSFIFAAVSFYYSFQPKDTKLTTKTNYDRCSSSGEMCYQLFVYNNDEAPCFEFKINYRRDDYKEVFLMKDYEKSSLFNASYENGTISFPPRRPLPINGLNKSNVVWLGFLGNKEIAYFSFIPRLDISPQKEMKVTCIDFEKSVRF